MTYRIDFVTTGADAIKTANGDMATAMKRRTSPGRHERWKRRRLERAAARQAAKARRAGGAQ